jgi:hypothetical protein
MDYEKPGRPDVIPDWVPRGTWQEFIRGYDDEWYPDPRTARELAGKGNPVATKQWAAWTQYILTARLTGKF